MDICNRCGSTMIRGICPHCGKHMMRSGSETVYQCISKAAECLDKEQWEEAIGFVLKGYEMDISNKDLAVVELLALTQMLRIVPDSTNEEERVRTLLKNMGDSAKFRYKNYDLAAYRSRLHSHDLANTTLSWWQYLIYWVIAIAVICGLFALMRYLLTIPIIGLLVALAILYFIIIH